MFKKGDRVICVNDKMDPLGPGLTKGKVYIVEEYVTLEELRNLTENQWWLPYWEKDGSKDLIRLKDGTGWSSHRFKAAATIGVSVLED